VTGVTPIESPEVVELLERAAGWESATLIRPHRRLRIGLRELWAYRELLYFLVWRDLKVRYKQSVVGVAWVILQPLATMTLFTIVFGHLMKVQTGGTPYPLFVLTGLVAWQLFAAVLVQSGTSLTAGKQLVTKVYFPRMLLPTATVIAALVDFAIASLVLACFLAGYGIVPPARIAALPLFLLLLVTAALGVALWVSALNVQYRDIQHTTPFLTQFWFFATPIVYSTAIVPSSWRLLLGVNPMAGVVAGLRWSLFGDVTGIGGVVTVSTVFAVVLLVTGFAYFRSTERTFADVV
jgi:lipopolysaccharide transport system permease protein